MQIPYPTRQQVSFEVHYALCWSEIVQTLFKLWWQCGWVTLGTGECNSSTQVNYKCVCDTALLNSAIKEQRNPAAYAFVASIKLRFQKLHSAWKIIWLIAAIYVMYLFTRVIHFFKVLNKLLHTLGNSTCSVLCYIYITITTH